MNSRGIVLTVVLIFIIILCMIAGVSIILISNQALITEGNIGRTKAFYTGQAAIVQMIDELRNNPADTEAFVTVNDVAVTARKIPRNIIVPADNPNYCNAPLATNISCIRVDIDY